MRIEWSFEARKAGEFQKKLRTFVGKQTSIL